MGEKDDKLIQLEKKLNLLLEQQKQFGSTILSLQQELKNLKKEEYSPGPATNLELNQKQQVREEILRPAAQVHRPVAIAKPAKPRQKTSFERFLGENLINKIGILILVFGVGIGAKYAIDKEIIGPTIRIILGYILGLGLLGLAIKLKNKYTGFSAVLLSGAMAIMYFITFAAHNFYSMMPQGLTFGFLLLFTAFTVFASINYKKQIIAHIGLVGAYAIPFLLSNNSGNTLFLFTYMCIVNIGILGIAIARYWKALYISSFSFTWLIYAVWLIFDYDDSTRKFALTFLGIFFVISFSTLLAYKIIRNSKFAILDLILILINSFVFYGLGYAIIADIRFGETYLGIFTLATAILHFIVALIVHQRKLADKNMFKLLAGLVLVFLTLTFPVQLDGGWVTMLWIGEALVLFWIGRVKKAIIYEYLSYPLVLLAFFSLIHDWTTGYFDLEISANSNAFLNITFATSLLVTSCLTIILYLFNKYNDELSSWQRLFGPFLAIILIITTYLAFRFEIGYYWQIKHWHATIPDPNSSLGFKLYNYDLKDFKKVWLSNYTLLFLSALSIALISVRAKKIYAWVLIGFSTYALLFFLSSTLYQLSELRDSYLDADTERYFTPTKYNLYIRYISFIFVASLLFSIRRMYVFLDKKLETLFGLILVGSLFWILSSEVLHWLNMAGVYNTYKTGLSIFWGLFAIGLIAYGIFRRKAYLRITALGILGITLIKLIVYDLSHMTTISRAIIFIILGTIMLGISFLYNKYKHIITGENETKQ